MTSAGSSARSGDTRDGQRGTALFLGRTVLRPYCAKDAEAIIAALQDSELAGWLAALPVPVDRNSAEMYLQFLGDPDVRAQVLTVDGKLVGVVSLGTELSFWIRRAFHGRGLGSWAVGSFLNRLPTEFEVVSSCCMAENKSASAVLLKLGFDRVGPPFRRFSFAHEHAIDFLRFQRRLQIGDQEFGA